MILYVQTAFLGDLLLSLPALKRLRRLYPDQEIHLLCRKNLGSLFLENGVVDKVFDQFQKTKPNFFEVLFHLRQEKYDLLICPHESFRSAWISSLIKAQKKIGFLNSYSRWAFTETVPRNLSHPEVLRQLSLLCFIDADLKTSFQKLEETHAPFQKIPAWSSMALEKYQAPDQQRAWRIKYKVKDDRPLVCLAPGSVWPTKQWGVESYRRLCQSLLAKGFQVLLVGSPAEKVLSHQIESFCPGVLNATGETTLIELAELIALSDVLVCNDSGAMHMASMTSTPTVSLFGPTVLSFGYQPWNPQARVLENKTLNCRPCSSHGGAKCPIGTHECMTSISVQEVQRLVEELLS